MAGAIEVTKLLVPLVADIRDFQKKMGQAEGIGKRFAKGMAGVGKLAIGGLGVLAAGAGAVGGALAKLAIDAAPLAGVKSAFEGVAQAAGVGGAAMLSALQEGSTGMITNRDLMLSFNKAAALVSDDFATQLPDAMQYLSKVSAATGQDMGFMMDSLVTGVGRLSPMILDNLAIQVSLADATARASEMFGVEAGALTKTQQQAGMMNVVLEKLEANTAAMPDVAGSAAAGLASLATTFQNTKDDIGLALQPALQTLLGLFGDLASRVLPPLTDFIEGTLAPALEKITGGIEDFVWMLSVGVEPLDALGIALSTAFGPEVSETIMGIITSVQEFVTTVQEMLEPVMEWIDENVELQDVLIGLGAAIAFVVVPAIAGIVGSVLLAIGVFVAVMATVAALRTAWENDFLGIRTALTEFWDNTAKPAFEDLWQWLQVNVPLALETLRALWVDVVWPAIQTAIETVWPIIETIFTAISTWITDTAVPALTDLYNKWVTEVWPAIQTAVETAWETVEPIWESIKKWAAETLPAALDDLRGFFETALGAIGTAVETVKGIWDGFVGAVTKFWDWLQGKSFNIPTGGGGGGTGYPGVPGGGLAEGTRNWQGGLTWVGEDGPELANIPRGSQIMSAPVSLALLEDAIAGGVREIHHHYPVTVNTQATTGTYLQDLALAQSQV